MPRPAPRVAPATSATLPVSDVLMRPILGVSAGRVEGFVRAALESLGRPVLRPAAPLRDAQATARASRTRRRDGRYAITDASRANSSRTGSVSVTSSQFGPL